MDQNSNRYKPKAMSSWYRHDVIRCDFDRLQYRMVCHTISSWCHMTSYTIFGAPAPTSCGRAQHRISCHLAPRWHHIWYLGRPPQHHVAARWCHHDVKLGAIWCGFPPSPLWNHWFAWFSLLQERPQHRISCHMMSSWHDIWHLGEPPNIICHVIWCVSTSYKVR